MTAALELLDLGTGPDAGDGDPLRIGGQKLNNNANELSARIEKVISRLVTPPGAPGVGDRYLVGNSATGAWTGRDADIAEWDGGAWIFSGTTQGNLVTTEGQLTYVSDAIQTRPHAGLVSDWGVNALPAEPGFNVTRAQARIFYEGGKRYAEIRGAWLRNAGDAIGPHVIARLIAPYVPEPTAGAFQFAWPIVMRDIAFGAYYPVAAELDFASGALTVHTQSIPGNIYYFDQIRFEVQEP